MNAITRVLDEVRQGKPEAAAELLPLVYDELRKLAAARLAHEKPGHTLDATALVHEAYLRLLNPKSEARNSKSEHPEGSDFEFRASDFPRFDGRGHFFAAAAEAMRRILVDSARRKQAEKHGGGLHRHDATELYIAAPETDEDLVALDEALDRFAAIEPQKAELVKLRYFAGLTIEQAAEALGISPATAKRYWTYSKAWLYQAVAGGDPSPRGGGE